MSRIVFCYYLNEEAEGLDYQPYPGEIGLKIFNKISKLAWQEWMKKQTMLINEYKLNMTNMDHRKQLESEMIKFLFEGEDIIVAGYKPQE